MANRKIKNSYMRHVTKLMTSSGSVKGSSKRKMSLVNVFSYL